VTVLGPTNSNWKHGKRSEEDILNEQQKIRERLLQAAGIYQGADRILTGERLQVALANEWNAPSAWTDGTTIFFNTVHITTVDSESIPRMHGMNFHELAHVLYSPRKGTSLMFWIMDNGYKRAANILEDQRIETLLTTRYPSTAPWLQTAVLRWVLENGVSGHGYMWVRGRKYLDGRVRGALRAAFVRKDLLAEIDSIIDAYRVLAFPTDYEAAKPLIERFAEILIEVAPPRDEDGPGGCGGRPGEIDKGRPKGPTEQKQTRDKAKDGEPEQEPQPKGKGKGDDAESDESESGKGKGEEEGDESDESGSGDGEGEDGDESSESGAGDEGDDEGDSSSESGSDEGDEGGEGQSEGGQSQSEDPNGNAAGNGAGSSENILKDIAEEVLSEILNSDTVKEDIRQTQRTMRGITGSDILERAKWDPQEPNVEFGTLFGELFRTLSRLLQAADPGWQDRQAAGRINVDRFTREGDYSTAFDVWDDGVHEASSMEVVIAVDESGSMGGVKAQAISSMWVLKRALDKIGASTTVLTFDDSSRILYHRSEKATTEVRWSFHGGGTNPVEAFSQAARIFAGSDKAQKVMIVFTDGEWYAEVDEDGVTADEYIARLNTAGVITALGFINSGGWDNYGSGKDHGVQIHRTVTVSDLVPFVSGIVTESIKRTMRRR
jgi:hypothetical protein